MVSPFERCIEFILRFEGDYSDDPHDGGGATRYGISKKSYPHLNIKALTREEAIELYRADFWNRCKCNELPAPLAMIVMDCAVNQGPGTAIRLLQKTLDVTADGTIGPKTIAAAHRCSLRLAVPELVARRAFQYAQHPMVGRYGLGWYRRLAACHQISQEPL